MTRFKEILAKSSEIANKINQKIKINLLKDKEEIKELNEKFLSEKEKLEKEKYLENFNKFAPKMEEYNEIKTEELFFKKYVLNNEKYQAELEKNIKMELRKKGEKKSMVNRRRAWKKV